VLDSNEHVIPFSTMADPSQRVGTIQFPDRLMHKLLLLAYETSKQEYAVMHVGLQLQTDN